MVDTQTWLKKIENVKKKCNREWTFCRRIKECRNVPTVFGRICCKFMKLKSAWMEDAWQRENSWSQVCGSRRQCVGLDVISFMPVSWSPVRAWESTSSRSCPTVEVQRVGIDVISFMPNSWNPVCGSKSHLVHAQRGKMSLTKLRAYRCVCFCS